MKRALTIAIPEFSLTTKVGVLVVASTIGFGFGAGKRTLRFRGADSALLHTPLKCLWQASISWRRTNPSPMASRGSFPSKMFTHRISKKQEICRQRLDLSYKKRTS